MKESMTTDCARWVAGWNSWRECWSTKECSQAESRAGGNISVWSAAKLAVGIATNRHKRHKTEKDSLSDVEETFHQVERGDLIRSAH